MQVSQAQLLYSHVLGMSNVGCSVPTQAGQAVGSRLGQSSRGTGSAEDLACEEKDLFSPSHLSHFPFKPCCPRMEKLQTKNQLLFGTRVPSNFC